MPIQGLQIGDYVTTPGGFTGRITSVSKDRLWAKVRLATGAHVGQVRKFRQAGLRRNA